jgi:hypothetical protein
MLTFFCSKIGGAMPALENPLKLKWGFRSIGEFIETDERKAQYLVKSGRLPAAVVRIRNRPYRTSRRSAPHLPPA